ncbi:hypothetical protein [Couchioplanes caeruleus]|uniref:Uncharacterized protein n=2 Tax=Couchioplanes caeruleus TaxID=56438 RepID=A0A1K0FDA5_9ACTN|nr:hypothetical protein [Couchioplanes caeruleus]OJF10728.1 hypothetical protein BG844_30490 [Couchioplanes caeruleus subsp. caeruleus]ROP31277.1 hypothetical protein EDD30_4172 [Couchioplanes caeruleus]
MAYLDGLDNAEYLVLAPLELGTPRPLWEIAEDFVRSVVGAPPTKEEVAALLGPGLASLAARELVEVRQFSSWPAAWVQGIPVDDSRLSAANFRTDAWAGYADGQETVVALITEAGLQRL